MGSESSAMGRRNQKWRRLIFIAFVIVSLYFATALVFLYRIPFHSSYLVSSSSQTRSPEVLPKKSFDSRRANGNEPALTIAERSPEPTTETNKETITKPGRRERERRRRVKPIFRKDKTRCPMVPSGAHDCSKEPDCCPPGLACYRANRYWAGCRVACTKTENDQCELLSSSPPQESHFRLKNSISKSDIENARRRHRDEWGMSVYWSPDRRKIRLDRDETATVDPASIIHVAFLLVNKESLLFDSANVMANILSASPGTQIAFHIVTDLSNVTSEKFYHQTGFHASIYKIQEKNHRFRQIKKRLDSAFREPARVKRAELEFASLHKPLFHLILPYEIDRVIILDNDVYFLESIKLLWDQFDAFHENQVLGLALEMNPSYHGCWNFTEHRDHFHPQHGFQGFNGGVQLAYLSRMRKSRYQTDILVDPNLARWLLRLQKETGEQTPHYWKNESWKDTIISYHKYKQSERAIDAETGKFALYEYDETTTLYDTYKNSKGFYVESMYLRCSELPTIEERQACETSIRICPVRMTNYGWWWGDQTFHSLVASAYPDLYYTLPCDFNWQLCTHYSLVFHNWHSIYDCDYQSAKVLHANCHVKNEISALQTLLEEPSRIKSLWMQSVQGLPPKHIHGPKRQAQTDPRLGFTGQLSTFGNLMLFRYIRQHGNDSSPAR